MGMQRMAYRVSPTCFLKMAGPIKRENSLTWTPEAFATRKWPSSWTKIRMLNSRIANTIVISASHYIDSRTACRASRSAVKISSKSGLCTKLTRSTADFTSR